jgi:hypothetical protein
VLCRVPGENRIENTWRSDEKCWQDICFEMIWNVNMMEFVNDSMLELIQ